ncbi:MAG TPA: N-acetylglucosamine-6-phosphate deacetylase [Chthoniobacterales bacterium]
MIFTNGRLILPEGIADGLNLTVEEGLIRRIGPPESASAGDIIDLEGSYLSPGFIDLHIHGAVGRDTMEGSKEVFAAICDYHASGGTTSLLLTTTTAPIPEIARVLQDIEASVGIIPQILGAHVEGPFISRSRPGAQREEFICAPRSDLVDRLLEQAGPIKQMTLAPEVTGALDLIQKLRARGIRVSGGHSDAWDEEARVAFAHGMHQVTHTFNCMSTMRRRGRNRVAGLLEFAISEPGIMCELIADGHHVSPTLVQMLYRAKGVAGIILVTDATAGAGLPDGTSFALYGKDCIVAEGVCMLVDRSALAGSASRMIDLVRTMVQKVGVPLQETVRMATENPARAIGVDHRKGRLAAGMDADLVVFSPSLEIRQTFVGGRSVYSLMSPRSK